eukprot:5589078-Lingulodinium_polyedra.AAC.1
MARRAVQRTADNDVLDAISHRAAFRGPGATLAVKVKAHTTEEQLTEGRITNVFLKGHNAV